MPTKLDFTSTFESTEHVIPCQNIRGYPHSTKSPSALLKLAIKQYTPTFQVEGTQPKFTIIAAHANGIVKETYEPLWEELNTRLKGRIKGIWIADCSHQGISGILNEGKLGDDPSWFDHSRDLLSMVNHFRDLIQPPIVGIGHSLGCAQLVHLSIMHPSLFQGLVLIEPVIQEKIPPGKHTALLTTFRADHWDSLEDARSHFTSNKFFMSWDPRALEKYVQYGTRRTPTALYPDATTSAVALKTTKAQEAWTILRPNFSARPLEDDLTLEEQMKTVGYTTDETRFLFHRPEAGAAFRLLPILQPSVKWIFGSQSYINLPETRGEKVEHTAKAIRGNGTVSADTIAGGGHMVPLERIPETAQIVASYIEEQLGEFAKKKAFWESHDSGKSDPNKLRLSERWKEAVRQKPDMLRPALEKGKL